MPARPRRRASRKPSRSCAGGIPSRWRHSEPVAA
jgi:hypothetical protein